MATTLSYTVADFQPFTKIVSADMNSKLNDIKTRINWAGGTSATTGLGDDNIQSNTASGGGLTRASKLKAGTANFVVTNDGTGKMSEAAQVTVGQGGLGTDFSASLASNPLNALIVNSGGTAFTLGSPIQASLTESFTGVVSSLTAGEAIAANDACAIDVGVNTSGATIYRVFKADYTKPSRRRSFLGFAQAAATVTAGVYTWVASANFVTSNSITFNINGRTYVVAFTSNNATTLQAVATAMATDPDVSGAVSDGSHTVTVTGRGGLTLFISGSLVTGGASQPTITFGTTTVASGQNVLVQCFGPLAGFSGLTVASQYYEDTAGGITAAPVDTAPIQVGQALSATVLFISTNPGSFQFGTPSVFVRSHGTTSDSAANGTQDVEHFNYSTWSAGTSSSVGIRAKMGNGDYSYQGFHHQLDGLDSGGSLIKTLQKYNKATWSTLTNRGTGGTNGGAHAFNGFLYAPNGGSSAVDKWNGTTWSAATAAASTNPACGNFTQGSLFHSVGGTSALTHLTFNTSDVAATTTAFPITGRAGSSSATAAAGYASDAVTTNTYRWSGSWSSAIVAPYITSTSSGAWTAASGFNTANSLATINGGNTISGTSVTNTANFNDTSWSATTASTQARAGGVGSVI